MNDDDDDEQNRWVFHAVYKSLGHIVKTGKPSGLEHFVESLRQGRIMMADFPRSLEMSEDEVIEIFKTEALNTSLGTDRRFVAVMGLVDFKVPGAHCGYMMPCVRPRSKNALCCVCGEKATGRCSGCEMVFYCGEEHQFQNHDEHKCFCRLSIKRHPMFDWMCMRDPI